MKYEMVRDISPSIIKTLFKDYFYFRNDRASLGKLLRNSAPKK